MATPRRRIRRRASFRRDTLPLALLLVATLGGIRPARSMTMQLAPVPGADSPVALLQGRIVQGDAAQLRRLLAKGDFSAVLLNSPGGSVTEATDMARAIHMLRVPVVVPDRAVCASACFMLFAAARDRVVEPGAMVGVHSASVSGGNETMDTLGVTTLMAREAAQYGVPPGITGRMVTTAPGQMAWLTRDELGSMGARIVSTRTQTAGRVLPGSDSGSRSDWTRGFERGQALGEGGDCTPPGGIANQADFALGCASGRRAGGSRVAALPSGSDRKSDWTRGFEYGRSLGRDARCESPREAAVDPRDFALGCASGRRVGGDGSGG